MQTTASRQHCFPATSVRDRPEKRDKLKLKATGYPRPTVLAFLSFTAAKVDPKETRDLVAYAQLVVHVACKHGGKGLVSYDHLFFQQVAAGAIAR